MTVKKSWLPNVFLSFPIQDKLYTVKKVDTNEPNMFAICWLSLLLVPAFFRGFFFRALAFLPSTMTNNSNSNLIRVEDPPAKAAAASSLNTEIYFI